MKVLCLAAVVTIALWAREGAASLPPLGIAVDLGLFGSYFKEQQDGLGLGGSIRPFVGLGRSGSSHIGLGVDVSAGQAWLNRKDGHADVGLGRTLWALANIRWFMRSEEAYGAAELGAGPAWFLRKLEGGSRSKSIGPTTGGMILGRISGYVREFGPIGGFYATGFQFFENGAAWVTLLGVSTQWTTR